LSAHAILSFLPTIFGIEFALRNPNDPSRNLDDDDVLKLIATQSGKEVSKEIDIFGYVDYFNQNRIEIGGEDRVTCIARQSGGIIPSKAVLFTHILIL